MATEPVRERLYLIGLVSNRRLTLKTDSPGAGVYTLYSLLCYVDRDLDGYAERKIDGLEVGERFYLPTRNLAYWFIRRIS